MVVFPYTVKQGIYHKHDSTVNKFVDYFALNAIEQILKTAVIAVFETLYRKYHIPYRHDHHMRSDCIITRAVAFRPQLQVTFGDFEIGLDVPAQHVCFQNLFFRQGHIRAHEAHPVFAVAVVARVHKLCRDFVPAAVRNGDVHGQQISGFPAPLFVAGIDFLYVQPGCFPCFGIRPCVFYAVFLDHGNCVRFHALELDELGRVGEPCVKQHKIKGDSRLFGFPDHAAYGIDPFFPSRQPCACHGWRAYQMGCLGRP